MATQRHAVTHYALLIGINTYPELSLKSCVRDVQNMAGYLRGILHSVHVQVLTATKNEDDDSCGPIEEPSLWPTYQNVISAFERITVQAKAGDFVYIHYSGHGTRTPWEPFNEFSNRFTGDLALVLLDGAKGTQVRYLWGSRLAISLKAMVDKELKVTLVLDCCFSASVSRHKDSAIRFLPYDAELGSALPSDSEVILGHGFDLAGTRDASMLPNWLLNPSRYAILAACGPHEFAKELKSLSGESHGALSYFLLRTFLECGGMEKKHKVIYHHLCAQFRKHWPQQNPVLYGNKDQGFFGNVDIHTDVPSIPIIELDGGLQLQAGEAHGICQGDEFALSPLGSNIAYSDNMEAIMIARTTQVRALRSELELLGSPSVPIETGWIAKHLTQISLRQFPIRLASNLTRLDEWIIALRKRSLDVYPDTDRHLISYNLVLNESKEYEILDEDSQKIGNLPTIRQDETDINYICDVLLHLVRYKLVRDLANKLPTDPFTRFYEAQIITRSGEIFVPGSVIAIQQDEAANFTFELRVANFGDSILYVHVFDIGPLWQVQDIYHGHEVILPQRKGERFSGMLKKLKTMVPVEMIEKGYCQCEDIIKVLITSQPTSFDLLELPKLGQVIKKNAASRIYHKQSEVAEWAALNFSIRTYLK